MPIIVTIPIAASSEMVGPWTSIVARNHGQVHRSLLPVEACWHGQPFGQSDDSGKAARLLDGFMGDGRQMEGPSLWAWMYPARRSTQ